MTTRTDSFLAGLALTGVLAALAVPEPHAQTGSANPDPRLTPGAVATSDAHGPDGICTVVGGLTYTRRHRVWDDKQETLARYGIPASQARDYEDDDRVPVCLGGDNASPLNHWPEVWPQAHVKDRLDAEACRLVCEGKVAVVTAQGWFLGDWRDGYRAVFHEDPSQ